MTMTSMDTAKIPLSDPVARMPATMSSPAAAEAQTPNVPRENTRVDLDLRDLDETDLDETDLDETGLDETDLDASALDDSDFDAPNPNDSDLNDRSG